MSNKKAKLEAAISNAFITFHQAFTGSEPLETRTYIIEDMVIVRTRGVLTIEESHLVQCDRGRQVVKAMRQLLRENSSQEVQQIVSRLCGSHVISSHSDISTKTGERVEVFVLDENQEKKLK